MEEYTVSRLSALIQRAMEERFHDIILLAEISSLKIATSGHVYFSLKDPDSTNVIDAICWKGVTLKHAIKLSVGMKARFFGRVTTYPSGSKYNYVVEKYEPAGIGELLKMLEERKKKLAAEGLFDVAKKKALPKLPRLIGVVTSPTGAVIQDILKTLNRRFPREVLLWPVLVQGADAANQIAAAVDGMNKLSGRWRPDVVIVARGGGSFEDLMPFNEEIVVRAVANSVIPIVSGVGHETDTTLIDYAADVRAVTPTAAAELVIQERIKLREDVNRAVSRLNSAILGYIEKKKLYLNSHKVLSVQGVISDRIQRADFAFDRLRSIVEGNVALKKSYLQHMSLQKPKIPDTSKDLFYRLTLSFGNLLKNKKNLFALAVNSIEANSYSKILKKGFAFVEASDLTPLTSAKSVASAREFNLVFADGSIKISKKMHQMELF